MNLAQALQRAQRAGLARLDAQLLLAHVLQRPRVWLLAHDDEALAAPDEARFDALVAQRAALVPLAYLTGRREFHGLELVVGPGVLVPRPETELLVDWALEVAPAQSRVVDLGCGSGAVALAIQHARPDLRMTASDLSAEALAITADNAQRLGLAIEMMRGSWWAPLEGRRFDLVVSNPPYVAEADPHLVALVHEPISALTAGADGLDALREIADGAPAHLNPGGWMLLEHGHDQADAVAAMLRAAGFCDIATRRDLAGHRRCTGGRLGA